MSDNLAGLFTALFGALAGDGLSQKKNVFEGQEFEKTRQSFDKTVDLLKVLSQGSTDETIKVQIESEITNLKQQLANFVSEGKVSQEEIEEMQRKIKD